VYWNISRGFRRYVQNYGGYYSGVWGIGVDGNLGLAHTHFGPKLLIHKGYSGIQHDTKIWGWWDGIGDYELWLQFGGAALIQGKNLILDIAKISVDTVWQAGFENAGVLSFPPFSDPNYIRDSSLTITAAHPVEDWKFNFCKHNDFGGAVTWTP
jgi:hypothetical protein